MTKNPVLMLLALVLASCQTVTPTPTLTLTVRPSPTNSPTVTVTPTLTPTMTATVTPTLTATPTDTPTPTSTPTPTPIAGSFVIQCNNSGQLCLPVFTTLFEVGVPSAIQAKYSIANGHCASLRIRFSVDDVAMYTSGFLGWPGASSPFDGLPFGTGFVRLGLVSAGKHVLGLQAEGQPSGCNSGGIGSWGGSYTVKLSPMVTITPTP